MAFGGVLFKKKKKGESEKRRNKRLKCENENNVKIVLKCIIVVNADPSSCRDDFIIEVIKMSLY